MRMPSRAVLVLVAGAFFAVAPWASAQMPVGASQPGQISGPDYGGSPDGPAADGRPGLKYFQDAMNAYRRGDIEHAIYMLKLSAYWAYAPAAYDLGVFYFRGEHVKRDRPLGTAWMFIAAEGGGARYVDARHLMVTDLDPAERTAALAMYQRLQPKYGYEPTMRRAKARWAFAKSQKTGSRVGGAAGELRLGISGFGAPQTPGTGPSGGSVPKDRTSAMQVLNGGIVQDGDLAYGQFHQSTNPYSVVLQKNRKGSAQVGPLQEIHQPVQAKPGRSQPAPAATAGQPSG